MNRKINIGVFESICAIILSICMQIFLNLQIQFVDTGGTAAWLVAVYVAVLSFFAFWIVSKLFKRFPGKDVFDIGKEISGKAGQMAAGIVLVSYAFIANSIVLREFSEDLKTIIMPTSPLSFLSIIFIITIIIFVRFGLETLVRVSAIFVPIISVGYLVIIFGVYPYYDFSQITPILGNGLDKILGEGFLRLSLFTPLIFIYILPPFLKTYDNFKKVGYLSLTASNFSIISSVLVFTIVFPYPTSSEIYLPFYALSRLIHFGRFFDRLESIFMPIWVLAAAIYLSGAFFLICYSIMKTFDLPYMNPLIMPVAILLYTASFIPQSVFETILIENWLRTWGGLIPGFGLPIIFLIIAMIRKKGSPQSKSPSA